MGDNKQFRVVLILRLFLLETLPLSINTKKRSTFVDFFSVQIKRRASRCLIWISGELLIDVIVDRRLSSSVECKLRSRQKQNANLNFFCRLLAKRSIQTTLFSAEVHFLHGSLQDHGPQNLRCLLFLPMGISSEIRRISYGLLNTGTGRLNQKLLITRKFFETLHNKNEENSDRLRAFITSSR